MEKGIDEFVAKQVDYLIKELDMWNALLPKMIIDGNVVGALDVADYRDKLLGKILSLTEQR